VQLYESFGLGGVAQAGIAAALGGDGSLATGIVNGDVDWTDVAIGALSGGLGDGPIAMGASGVAGGAVAGLSTDCFTQLHHNAVYGLFVSGFDLSREFSADSHMKLTLRPGLRYYRDIPIMTVLVVVFTIVTIATAAKHPSQIPYFIFLTGSLIAFPVYFMKKVRLEVSDESVVFVDYAGPARSARRSDIGAIQIDRRWLKFLDANRRPILRARSVFSPEDISELARTLGVDTNRHR